MPYRASPDSSCSHCLLTRLTLRWVLLSQSCRIMSDVRLVGLGRATSERASFLRYQRGVCAAKGRRSHSVLSYQTARQSAINSAYFVQRITPEEPARLVRSGHAPPLCVCHVERKSSRMIVFAPYRYLPGRAYVRLFQDTVYWTRGPVSSGIYLIFRSGEAKEAQDHSSGNTMRPNIDDGR